MTDLNAIIPPSLIAHHAHHKSSDLYMNSRSLKTFSLLGCLFLTACASGPEPRVDYVKARERFQGILPCATCRGVDTDLILQRDPITGSPEDFYLHEVRIDAPGGQRVTTSWGNWSRYQEVEKPRRWRYVLQPKSGSPRTYTLRDEGKLQPLDSRGRPMTDDTGEPATLTPLIPDLAPPDETREAERPD
ncbi:MULTISPECIES: copper resistance protein NlpE N-terminal domain-containing protein [unclassified Modicisalibacter]|uniref:copper resistance protein NlpE N-terminal domain-containing protein n=1 Tax=unclassified Modicisalibacter TaxID=2679913 RepID=UPI001CCD2AD5|nr:MULTISPECIES: copper resistance protein NlpE N-terminal domain-containing protein [unclassified Modicisalibacter]MBZ9556817.1 copper resistance protein NlpE N-terminal domain-containing protein [Modicisalibacter sp. R2A 31.J]MBZ9574713.1 copper resistance protein NlpE N-terminal domain-containing protein [Modicisalibacter sp. MOD 31.J]